MTETLQEGHRDLHQQQTVLLPAGENFSIQSHCELHSIGYKSYSLGMDFQKPDKNKWFMKYIDQLSQQLHNSGWRGAILQFWRAYLLSQPYPLISEQDCVCDRHHAGMVEVADQEGTGEKVSVSGVTAIS